MREGVPGVQVWSIAARTPKAQISAIRWTAAGVPRCSVSIARLTVASAHSGAPAFRCVEGQYYSGQLQKRPLQRGSPT